MGIEFDETRHIYTHEGMIVPSVTTIMKPLSESVYHDVDKATLEAAARRGTIIHNAIENWHKFGIIDVPDDIKGYFDAYMEFEMKWKPKALGNEIRLFHQALFYAGTADFLCEIDGKVYLIDFKTTSVLMPMLTRVQLEAYKQAVDNMRYFDKSLPQIDGKGTLQLKPDGKFVFELHEPLDAEAWNVFGNLMFIYRYIKKNSKS